MGRICHLLLQFDGAAFVGWQRQREGRTVQGELERVLERLCGHRIPVHGAGRTDAGVHAVGMSASCTVPGRWRPAALHRAMNALLAHDCWLADVREAQPGFHARKSASGRRYYYDIGTTDAAASPFRRPYEWALGRPLTRSALDAAAGELLGRHDFAALAVKSASRPDTRCDIRLARWVAREEDAGVRFEVTADRFLHHMVRMLVGTMVDIGLARRPAEDLGRLLARSPGVRSSPPAPAEGLFFAEALYPNHWFHVEGNEDR